MVFYAYGLKRKKTVKILIEIPNLLVLNNNLDPPRITQPNETYHQSTYQLQALSLQPPKY